MNYVDVYNKVDQLMRSREGLNNPKQKQSYNMFVRELTGIMCGVAHQAQLKDPWLNGTVMSFLDMLMGSRMAHFIDDGKTHEVEDLIHPEIVKHPMYAAAEFALMNYKPGKTQVGPGELFFCLFDCDSVFGIDNQAGYDIRIHGTAVELKKYGTNLTDPELFDKYHASSKVQQLLVVRPVSDAAFPLLRSRYSCITFAKTPWRDVYEHVGKNGTLAYRARGLA